MRRRDYLKTASSTAFLPVLADRVETVEPPEIDELSWQQSLNGEQILRVKTTQPVDSVQLRRYEFGELSEEPSHEGVDESTHDLVWDDPVTVVGIHSLVLRRNEQAVNEVLVDFDLDIITRHIEARENNAGRVAVRQKGQGTVAAYSGCVVTDNGHQPEAKDLADWQNQRHKQLSTEYTVYLQARVTDEALSQMRAHQTVSVWLRSETGAWYPATVDFRKYDPVEVYDTHGVKRL